MTGDDELERPLCACGCGKPTSGHMFHDRQGWRFPKYIKGHRPPQKYKSQKRRAGFDEAGCPAWVECVADTLERTGRAYTWLRAETGISRTALFRPGPKRPETIAVVSHALGLDVRESMLLAGFDDPAESPARMVVLQELARGQSRQQVADHIGVSIWTIAEWLTSGTCFLKPQTIDAMLAAGLLTEDEVQLERHRQQSGHSDAMRKGWDNLPPEVREERGRALGETSRHYLDDWRDKRRTRRQNAEIGKQTIVTYTERRILDAVARLRAGGERVSINSVATASGCNWSTVKSHKELLTKAL